MQAAEAALAERTLLWTPRRLLLAGGWRPTLTEREPKAQEGNHATLHRGNAEPSGPHRGFWFYFPRHRTSCD